MGVLARFQAMQEDSELFMAAREDREIAMGLQFFNQYVLYYETPYAGWSEKHRQGWQMARDLAAAKPDLLNRYFSGDKNFDAIVYLLSSVRQDDEMQRDASLIHQAIYGTDRLHPNATGAEGFPIPFVRAAHVPFIATYLDDITRNMLYKSYDPNAMYEAGVYAMSANDDEGRFDGIWQEFTGMRELYHAAMLYNEAVIITID